MGASRSRSPQRSWLIADRSTDQSNRGGSRSWGRRACSEVRTSPCRRPRSPRPPVAMLRWSEAAVSAPRPRSGVYVYGASATPATLAGAALFRARGVPGQPANAVSAERLERVEREDPLHLSERCAKSPGKDLEVVEVLLEFRDLDGKLGGAGIEGREVSLQLVRPGSEAVDLLSHLALERGAGAAKPEVSPQRADGAKQGEQRSQQDQNDRRDEHIISYRNTTPAAFTIHLPVLESSPRRGVEQSGSSSGS